MCMDGGEFPMLSRHIYFLKKPMVSRTLKVKTLLLDRHDNVSHVNSIPMAYKVYNRVG